MPLQEWKPMRELKKDLRGELEEGDRREICRRSSPCHTGQQGKTNAKYYLRRSSELLCSRE